MTKQDIIKSITTAFNIPQLNSMQQQVLATVESGESSIVLYSPTGSGKTIAFAIPLLMNVQESLRRLQAIVIAPSRELVIQINDVLKKIAPQVKTCCCYGGHKSRDEILSLQACPSIVLATPGRLVDHMNRGNLDVTTVRLLVIDEFDKTLELGFTGEMSKVLSHIPISARKILTSATVLNEIPGFVKLKHHVEINNLDNEAQTVTPRLKLWNVVTRGSSKIETLLKLLYNIPDEKTIIFSCSRKTSQDVYNHLSRHGMACSLYHGSLEQMEREKAVAMLGNGTSIIISATDLASRGLDISQVKHIIHYDLPPSQEIFTHRNGRTARTGNTGNAYLITSGNEPLPGFARDVTHFELLDTRRHSKRSKIATIFINAGKKEKIARGDIAGFIARNTHVIPPDQVGIINVFDHYSLVAVPGDKIDEIINSLAPFKLKGLKVKLSIAQAKLKFARK